MKILMTSVADKKAAKMLGKKLIKNGLAACVSSTKADSLYVWDDKICDEKERILLIKTDAKFKKIAKFIKANHDYELPEILSFKPKDIYKKYKIWVKNQTKGKK
ncbi:divalent-cation tolerance protein CutA [Campylobacter curvus]|uniref:divalent-cation tolerance protein CutA n=1 Tax=Campylobacter curvus TaxID=200 RepID=UPI0003A338F3|nr:divalent cation tolerance protein CutA [Campylobacter curvus]UEB49375.1 divalent-cation tolerance protein CutA [Campylobacter curvus]